jgi:hypothetical protein
MRTSRLVTILALLGLLLGGLLTVTPPRVRADGGTAGEACFQETGFCVRGRFLAYWTANGGLAINGFPLSEERQELLEDGNTYTVQYFERVRLEYHPENPAPWDVELGQFGRRVYHAAIPDPLPPIDERFRDYWLANGGLAQFGYPISVAYPERLEDGQTYTVQYFERARFELHPENPAPWDIEIGQFGRLIFAENTQLADTPAFFAVYVTNGPLRQRLGSPVGTAATTTGATLPFERGRMFSLPRGLVPFPSVANPGGLVGAAIYVLCGTPQSGNWFAFPNTDQAGQPTGGGAGPQPGLYEPGLGFGTLWHEHPAVRDCLGYATAPQERALPLTTQEFRFGVLLLAETEEGRFVDALTFSRYANGTVAPAPGRYERFPAPAR